MEHIPANKLAGSINGKTVFMVHRKEEQNYWDHKVPKGVVVQTSHALGYAAIRKAFRFKTSDFDKLKVPFLLDRLIPDEPSTNTQRERSMELVNAAFKRLASPVATEENKPSSDDDMPGYRAVVITLAMLAKKEAYLPQDLTAVESVLNRFTPYYQEFRTRLPRLDGERVIAYVLQALELSLPKDGALESCDFADQIWLPGILENVTLETIDTLLIEEDAGFYEAEKRMVERWRQSGTRVVKVARMR